MYITGEVYILHKTVSFNIRKQAILGLLYRPDAAQSKLPVTFNLICHTLSAKLRNSIVVHCLQAVCIIHVCIHVYTNSKQCSDAQIFGLETTTVQRLVALPEYWQGCPQRPESVKSSFIIIIIVYSTHQRKMIKSNSKLLQRLFGFIYTETKEDAKYFIPHQRKILIALFIQLQQLHAQDCLVNI